MISFIKPKGFQIITFPENLYNYDICEYSIKSKFKWFKKRKKFECVIIESKDDYGLTSYQDDINYLTHEYKACVKYTTERCWVIYNPYNEILELDINIKCYNIETYNREIKYLRNINGVTGI